MSCDMSKMSTMSCTTRSQGQVRAHYSSVLLCVVFVLCGANASGVGVCCHEMPLSHTHIEVYCKLLMHAHTHAHARACTCTHIHTHTHTYTHIHTHTYVTHGHTHTLSLSPPPPPTPTPVPQPEELFTCVGGGAGERMPK